MPNLYRQYHAAVIPSRQEGLGLISLEAQACGLPVFCYRDTGGLPETVVEGETGMLSDITHWHGMYNNIKDLQNNPAKYQEMSKNARQYVVNNFTLEKNAESFSTLYKKIFDLVNQEE